MISAKRKFVLLALGLWGAGFFLFVSQGFYMGHGEAKMVGYNFATTSFGVIVSLLMTRFFGRARRLGRAFWPSLVALSLVGALFHATADVTTQSVVWPILEPGLKLKKLDFVLVATFLQFAPLYATFVVAAELLRSGEIVAAQERALADSQRIAQEAKLEALRYQINPHFLFNALNAITSLIVAGRNVEAERASTMLGDFMRESLEIDPEVLVPLEQEIDAVATYVNIERIRFGPRLSVSFDVADDLMAIAVPPLLLQPLFENAIKHGLARTVEPVSIALTVEREAQYARITVANDAAPSVNDAPGGGTGTGLKNIRTRLAAIYGEEGRLETRATERGFSASILLPAA